MCAVVIGSGELGGFGADERVSFLDRFDPDDQGIGISANPAE